MPSNECKWLYLRKLLRSSSPCLRPFRKIEHSQVWLGTKQHQFFFEGTTSEMSNSESVKRHAVMTQNLVKAMSLSSTKFPWTWSKIILTSSTEALSDPTDKLLKTPRGRVRIIMTRQLQNPEQEVKVTPKMYDCSLTFLMLVYWSLVCSEEGRSFFSRKVCVHAHAQYKG